MTTTASAPAAWTMPDTGTTYYLEDGTSLTLADMLEGIDPQMVPDDDSTLEALLWAFGAWEEPELAHIAVAMREPGDKVITAKGWVLYK